MARINLVLSDTLFTEGIRQFLIWDTERAPHVGIAGITGTGKTYALKLILAKVSKHIKDSRITVCDFKGDKDFSFLDGCPNFYRFDGCLEGLNQFYNEFLETQRSGQKSRARFLVFDEWGAMLNFLDKKDADEAKKKLSTLLMLGRSFNYHVILSQQRLDAESFGKSRDNLNLLIVLGNPSKEVIGMFFNDYKEHISNDRTIGTGYMLINGAEFQKIRIPQISSMERVEDAIRQAVLR